MPTNLIVFDKNNVEEKIYYIRDKKVMLDSDLAKLYGYSTKDFNRKVKNNIEKFSKDSMFKLTNSETIEFSRCKKFTLNKSVGRGYNIKYNPYVFTEQGIKVLGSIMKKSFDITNKILELFTEDNNYPVLSNTLKIKDLIYNINGKQVMLDSDLARLYHVETKRINESVKNNPMKFPKRYSWVLTDEESEIFLVENFDQKIEKRGGKYKNPRLFTEQGVAMLATILKSDVAVQVSIDIMDAFVSMRKFIKSNLLEQQYINNIVLENRENIKEIATDVKLLQEVFDKLEEKEIKNKLFYNGKLYDAYSFILDILDKSNEEIVIIDNYADKTLLDIISNINKKVILITNKKLLKKLDIDKYNKQYNNLNIYFNNQFHDRYIILDKKELYLLGSSINHIGNKITSIILIEEEIFKKELFNKIKEIEINK